MSPRCFKVETPSPILDRDETHALFWKMDEAKHPIGFIPEPDLQNIQPLPGNAAATEYHQGSIGNGQSGTERGGKKGTKYRGRPSGSQHQPDNPEITPNVRPRQVIDARSTKSGDNSTGWGRDSAGRSHDVRRLRHDGDETIRRSPQQEWADEGSGHSEGGTEPNRSGRRVRVDQKRIVISRNMEGRRKQQSQLRPWYSGPLPTTKYRPKAG